MTTDSYALDEASGNGNAEAVAHGGPLRADATRARAREGLPHPNSTSNSDGAWSAWRAGAAATLVSLRDRLGDGSLWDDHPPSPRDVHRRIHDPAYAGPQVAGWKRALRYLLGYGFGMPMTLVAYALAWPFQSESRQIVTFVIVGVFLLLHIF